MSSHRYRFRSRWMLSAEATEVFAVLSDVESYPRWWPQVRSVRKIDDDRADVTIRSTLPYRLRFLLTRTVSEPSGRLLEAHMSGDLTGWSRWEVTSPVPGAVEVRFSEEAELTHALLRHLEPAARPLFVANHAVMIRGCRRGLIAAVAGYRIGARPKSHP